MDTIKDMLYPIIAVPGTQYHTVSHHTIAEHSYVDSSIFNMITVFI